MGFLSTKNIKHGRVENAELFRYVRSTDKRFILFHNMDESLTIQLRDFIEKKMSTSYELQLN